MQSLSFMVLLGVFSICHLLAEPKEDNGPRNNRCSVKTTGHGLSVVCTPLVRSPRSKLPDETRKEVTLSRPRKKNAEVRIKCKDKETPWTNSSIFLGTSLTSIACSQAELLNGIKMETKDESLVKFTYTCCSLY